MKKTLRLVLISIFCLVTINQLWQNLAFDNDVISLIKVSIILTVFELFLKPLVKILLLPINLLTLGTFRIVINTLGFYLAVFLLTDFRVLNISSSPFNWQGFSFPGLNFYGFFAYLVTSATFSIILYLFNKILTKKQKVWKLPPPSFRSFYHCFYPLWFFYNQTAIPNQNQIFSPPTIFKNGVGKKWFIFLPFSF